MSVIFFSRPFLQHCENMTDAQRSALQANSVALPNPVSTMGYASDVGIFCGVGGDTPTSTTGAWKRTRSYCPSGVSNCPGIVPNFSQRTGTPATLLTQTLPSMQAGVLLPAMQQGQFPTYQVPIVFTAFSRTPTVSAFKQGIVGGAYCTDPVLQTSSNGLNTFICNLVVSPAQLTLPVYQAEQLRIAAATISNPSLAQASLFNYLAKSTVTEFSILLQIDTPPFRMTSQNYVVNVTRPAPDNYYPPSDDAASPTAASPTAASPTVASPTAASPTAASPTT